MTKPSLGSKIKAWLKEKPTLGKEPLPPLGVKLNVFLYTTTGGTVTIPVVFMSDKYGSLTEAKLCAEELQRTVLAWFSPDNGIKHATLELSGSVIRAENLVALSTSIVDVRSLSECK